MMVLVASDFHLGKGRYFRAGHENILEDFDEDERFIEFVDFYSSGKYYFTDIHLVLNGDILNLIQIDIDGVLTHLISEEVTVKALKKIIDGHESFFQVLKKFLSRPNKKLTYVIGNHDFPLIWPAAQKVFADACGGEVEFVHSLDIHGIHIEHGHRFEAINTVPPHKHFIDGPNGQKVVNLPWGSLFCILALPLLKKDRPYLDRVRPLSTYIRWCFFHDFFYFMKLFWQFVTYVARTSSRDYIKQNKNFKTSIKLLKGINIFPLYEKQAKRILRSRPDVHTVVMGHTHVPEWRKFPENKYYFNTGTWNPRPSLDVGLHQSERTLNYVCIELGGTQNVIKKAALLTWQGKWRPYREEIAL